MFSLVVFVAILELAFILKLNSTLVQLCRFRHSMFFIVVFLVHDPSHILENQQLFLTFIVFSEVTFIGSASCSEIDFFHETARYSSNYECVNFDTTASLTLKRLNTSTLMKQLSCKTTDIIYKIT